MKDYHFYAGPLDGHEAAFCAGITTYMGGGMVYYYSASGLNTLAARRWCIKVIAGVLPEVAATRCECLVFSGIY